VGDLLGRPIALKTFVIFVSLCENCFFFSHTLLKFPNRSLNVGRFRQAFQIMDSNRCRNCDPYHIIKSAESSAD